MPPVNSARSNKDTSAIQPSTSPPPSFQVGQSEEELFEEELGETGTGGAERDEVGRRGGGGGNHAARTYPARSAFLSFL